MLLQVLLFNLTFFHVTLPAAAQKVHVECWQIGDYGTIKEFSSSN